MAGIYWLASYPKSGNTWMRILLTNYWRNGDAPANINDLDGGPIASARHMFDEWMGLSSADMTPAEIDAHRPLLYEYLAKKAETDAFMKVHDAYEYTIYSDPIFTPKATAGVIYIIRNPLDVAVSFAHHGHTTIDKIIEFMGSTEMGLVKNNKKIFQQFKQNLLSWSEHVCSWVDAEHQRVQVIRYEDMVMDPVATFGQVVRFCNLETDIDRLKKAVAFSSFETLQRQESEQGFKEKQLLAESFFRKGKVGSWREQLSDKQVTRLIDDHRDVMRRFNYLSQDDELIF